MNQNYQDIVKGLKYIFVIMEQQFNQMLNLFDHRIIPIEYVSLNILFLQHKINVNHLGYGNYKALSMETNTNVRTIIISLKT